MRIVSVEGRNFRSYKTLNWTLPDAGLYLIDGQNLDNGRNNMTGKTTLVDSIFWALYGYLPKWGGVKGGPVDAVIKRGETKCQVQVNIENEGKRIFVRRERPNKLFVEVDGLELQGKSTDLDSRIPDLIGMTAEQFLTAVYISQDRKQSFFTMGEADRTLLLSQVSKVDNINRGMEKAKTTKQNLEQEIMKHESFIQGLEHQISMLPNTIAEYEEDLKKKTEEWEIGLQQYGELEVANKARGAKYESDFESQRAALAANYEQHKAAIVMALKEAEAELSVKEAHQLQPPKIEVQYTQRIEELKKQIADAEEANQKSWRQEGDNTQARAVLLTTANAVEEAMNGKCDHCNQDLPNHMREEQIAKLLARSKEWEKKIADVPPRIDLAPLKAQLDQAMQDYARRKAELEAGPKSIQAEINFMKKGLDLQKQNLLQLEIAHKAEIKNLESTLSNSLRELDYALSTASSSVDILKRAMETAEASLTNVKKQAEFLQAEINTNKVKIFTLQKQLDEALDLIDVFKGFRQVCFEDLIARISDRAGQLLSLMTDGVYTTRIDQIGETSKGEAKLILKPMITKGGQDVPVDDLSGGARRTVMLAYDVAVAEAVGDSNVLFLDEALDGLDYMGKAEAMRLLEEVSRQKAVLAIDHSSEIKAAFSQIIQITYKDGTSQLVGESNVDDVTPQVLES